MKNILPFFILSSLLLTDLQAQDFNMQFRSNVPYPGYTCSSEWGYVDNSGNEYALVGTSFGVSIVDITNPDSPKVKFDIIHTSSFWREIKTYGYYAYATNEDGGGLLVMDLSQLPDTVIQYSFIFTDQNGYQQTDGHELWIDEHGRLYIFGGSYWSGGATMFDLTVDPINPPFVGAYENHYIHSGFVRGDTLWASEIFDGQVEAVNVSDPANSLLMSSFYTPSYFTHNAWPTHNNHYLFTTDEVSGAFVTSFDVSDLNNVTELDRVQSHPGTSVIPHNVHLLNDTFAVTAYYCDGVVVFDVAEPDNMIKVASYDTWPFTCYGYNGTWGAYPYLPSGNLILSNIEDGLFVLTPTYVQACRLEGKVTDSLTGIPLINAKVQMTGAEEYDYTDLSGVYKTGTGIAGTYGVKVTYPGYETKVINNILLENGITTVLDIQLKQSTVITLNGTVVDSATNYAVPFAHLHFDDEVGFTYDVTADASGNFSIADFNTNAYAIYAGKWGHETRKDSAWISISLNSLLIKIPRGYYDDFLFDEGWTTTGNVISGSWQRANPIGTDTLYSSYNPYADVIGDFGNECLVTGNNSSYADADDVDGGYTTITSPIFDLSFYADPHIKYIYWFSTSNDSIGNDSMIVFLSNGIITVPVKEYSLVNAPQAQWVPDAFTVSDFIQPTNNMTVAFYVSDHPAENILEAGIDQFVVTGNMLSSGMEVSASGHFLSVFPNPFNQTAIIQYDVSAHSGRNFTLEVFDVIGTKLLEIHLKELSGAVTLRNDFADGMYVVKLAADGRIVDHLKVVKSQ
ncbi:MAG: choice-of-anchor B family protein [Chitinophagales bacterium]